MADPVLYRAWRAARGDVYKDPDELERRHFVKSDYAELYNEPFPGWDPAFDRMFRDSTRRFDGHNRPVAIAVGPGAARLQIRRLNPIADTWLGTFGDESHDA